MQRDILSPHVVTKPTTKPTSQHAHTPNSVYSPTRTPLESLSRCLTHSLALALFLAVYALSLSQSIMLRWLFMVFTFVLLCVVVVVVVALLRLFSPLRSCSLLLSFALLRSDCRFVFAVPVIVLLLLLLLLFWAVLFIVVVDVRLPTVLQ